MLKNEQYLQQLGIERWRLREKSAAYHYYCIELCDGENPVGLLLADAVAQTDAEEKLVFAIAKSTNKQVRGGLSSSKMLPPPLPYRVIILLGQQVAHQVLKTDDNIEQMQHRDYAIEKCPVLVSYSPVELMNNKSLKTLTWQTIQKAMKLMG